jgi:hypothetical protein
MYTDRNFKKGTEVRMAVAAYLLAVAAKAPEAERLAVGYHQPGGMFETPTGACKFVLEGPHYPKPHSWYLQGVARDSKVVWVSGLPAQLNPDGKYDAVKGLAALRAKFPELAAKYPAA